MKTQMKVVMLVGLIVGIVNADAEVLTFHIECSAGNQCTDLTFENKKLSVKTPAEITIGPDEIESAALSDEPTRERSISLTFVGPIAKKLEETTRNNVGKKLILSLDGKVLIDPVIREAIAGGRVRIDGALGDKPFWENIDWLQKKIYDGTLTEETSHRRSVLFYVLIAAAVVVCVLIYAFFPRRKTA